MPLITAGKVIVVLSGKGGVGKSSVAVAIATSLCCDAGKRVGILDVDLTGPSVPKMLGVEASMVQQAASGWLPVRVNTGNSTGSLDCMSIAFLLGNPDNSVVWRGPKKNGKSLLLLC